MPMSSVRLFAGIAFVFLCPAAFPGPELLPNPGFESGPPGAADFWSIHTWQPYGAGYGSGKIIDSESAGSGRRCFQASALHPLSQVYLDRRNMPAKENTRYNISVSVKPQGAMAPSSLCRLQCTFLDERGKRLPEGTDPYLGSARTDVSGFSGEWIRIGFSTVSPPGTRFLSVTMRQIGVGDSLFDNISMTEGEPAETFSAPEALWRCGSARLEKEDSGRYKLFFSLKNPWRHPVEDLTLSVACSAGTVGGSRKKYGIRPGKTLSVELPLSFPGSFTSDSERIFIRGRYRADGILRKDQWMLAAEIGAACFDDLVKKRTWGIQSSFPKNRKENPEFAGVLLPADGGDVFFSRTISIPLERSTRALSLIFQIDATESLNGPLTLKWEFLDYFSRSEQGNINVRLPRGKTAVLKADLSAHFLRLLKRTVLDTNSVQGRVLCSIHRNGRKVIQKTFQVNFKQQEKQREIPIVSPRWETLPLYGKVRLIDEVVAGGAGEEKRMREGGKGLGAKTSSEPLDYYGGENILSRKWHLDFREKRDRFSRLETIAGKCCRTTGNWGWFAYFLGGTNVIPGKYYLLRIEYPCDISRNTLVYNGFQPHTSIGFHTGESLGDPHTRQTFMQKYSYPLTGKYEFHETVFRAEHSSAWVGIHSMGEKADPFSRGTAVHAIRLYELGDSGKLESLVPPATEPAGLPARILGYLNEDYLPTESDLLRCRFFGYNAFAPLLLMYCGGTYETNSGQVRWDSRLFRSEQADNPAAKRIPNYYKKLPAYLERFIEEPRNRNVRFFAALEYAGTGELPERAYARTPEGEYSGYLWGKRRLKNGISIDMAHPEVGRDMAKLVTELGKKYAAEYPNFQGIIFTVRFQSWQIGYGMDSLNRFAREKGMVLPTSHPGRWIQKNDLPAYRQWHYREKRKNFLLAADALRKVRNDLKFVILNYNAGDDNLHFGKIDWNEGRRREDPKTEFFIPGRVSLPDLKGRSLLKMLENDDAPDRGLMSVSMNPLLYRHDRGIWNMAMVHFPFLSGNREYLDSFRTGEGSSVCLWWIYNEDAGHNHTATGWDPPGLNGNEPSGRNSMMDAVLAMASSDPVLMFVRIGTLTHGYPQYAREFAQAYRSLPALPSEILPYPADSSVVIRKYPAGNRIFLGVINTSPDLRGKVVKLSAKAIGATRLRNLVTGENLQAANGVFFLKTAPVSLNSFLAEAVK